MAQNDNPPKHSGLQRRKIIESAGMGAGLGLFARLGGSTKEALIAGTSVGLLHYWLNDWNNPMYDKYKSSDEKQKVKTSDKSDNVNQTNGFAPLIFGSIVFLVSAGAGAVVNKGKELKKVITKSGIQALGIVGAIEIIKSTIGAIKDKKNKNRSAETKIIA